MLLLFLYNIKMEITYLKVGKIIDTFGLKGEVKVYTTSTLKDLRYSKNYELYIDLGDEKLKVTIKNHKQKDKNIDILSFNEFNNINDIEKFVGKELLAIKDNNDLYEDEYFYSDLENCIVFDEEHKELGKVIQVNDFNNVINLEVKLNSKDKSIFIPFNDFFVKGVDINNKTIIIHVIEGLLEI